PDRDETRSMRSKEEAHDYRYFPDPDLPPLVVEPAWVERVRAAMPELPTDMRRRLVDDYGLGSYDATTLTASRAVARFYEDTVAALLAKGGAAAADPTASAKAAANWVMVDLAAALNRDDLEIAASPVAPGQLADLIQRILDGTISNKIARDVFAELWGARSAEQVGATTVDGIIETRGLEQISDSGAIEKIVDEVLAANPKSVEEFRAGKEKAFNALVGQVMKATKGKANPQQVNELLRRRLG
ncbi:MAG TPA: Asp-tRNA(Asn)/Glu-tRNA(Gln) amidotransferase GatCAB subunit B, partial [Zeimonas sp.]|nr:Asp-tRNA(Asn)/Glu-tRNA(Gln) amidotransferase GatCAB subunit B [Zeimonas sp.]